MADSRRVLSTSEGSHVGDFQRSHWALVVLVALVFGSAFFWIALSLRSFDPRFLAFGRVTLGAGALALFPTARRRIDREDYLRIAVAGIVGQAMPAVLFALAEQRIESALTGMITGAAPITAALWAAIFMAKLPSRRRVTGLAVGSTGIALLSLPSLGEGGSSALGVLFVVIAISGYGLAANILVPMQPKYGAAAVILWALITAIVVLAPLGIPAYTPGASTESIVALLILGIVGTGVARTLHVSLIGRVGASRGSVVGYFLPLVALFLGVVVLDESISAIQVAGMLVVVLGAYILSRKD
jgi:drug/metabolite transporter (DMT)-like permease